MFAFVWLGLAAAGPTPHARAAEIWMEGEDGARSSMHRHPGWYDQVKRELFSEGDFISNYDKQRIGGGEAEYSFDAPKPGEYDFWVRANPVQSSMSYRLNGGQWTAIDMDRKKAVGVQNVAADGKADMRFIGWIHVGKVELRSGRNTLRFRMDSKLLAHGYLDCFVLTDEVFDPSRPLKPPRPENLAKRAKPARAAEPPAPPDPGWFAFAPAARESAGSDGLDLRYLNERYAGEGGYIQAKGGQFVHEKTQAPVRFWAVNGPPGELRDRESLRRAARVLAKYGVNMVRVHSSIYDADGRLSPATITRAIDVVECMKAEGIYTHFSIYFPLWLFPKPDNEFLVGYDGKTRPFAAIYFNKRFQEHYRGWWKALLTTPSPTTGKTLLEEPAVLGVEMVNEDSCFFWTFSAKNIPPVEMEILEREYGDWLKARYGSPAAALLAWKGVAHPRDNPAEGRMGFRILWDMFHRTTDRDRDAARFLVQIQRTFYADTVKYLRELGFRGVVTASNFHTASPEFLGPLDKYTHTAGDFMDRHGYFACGLKGENSAWSLRVGHTYVDRSALRFDPEEPGKPRLFFHPAMDPSYNDLPSMISETTFCRPNRFRSEAPLFFAAYGALQGSDAIVHFTTDGLAWRVKPKFHVQPWTLSSPAMMGQFPAAALIFRRGLVAPGERLVELNLKLDDLLDLKGTPLPQEVALDDLRRRDWPADESAPAQGRIDPLVHLAGRVNVRFTEQGGQARIADLSACIDRKARRVAASTGQMKLDYGRGLLTIDAPAAQGVSGALAEAGAVALHDMTIQSDLPLGHIVAVAMDGVPLAQSRRILLQAMSEEKPAGFRSEPTADGRLRIVSLGKDPWTARNLSGTVKFTRPDAASLRVIALDHAGAPQSEVGRADAITLAPTTAYYLIRP